MKYLSKLALGTVLLAVASVSFGQVVVAPDDAIQQEEMGNLNSAVGDSFIHMFNAATNGGTDGSGSIVAQVYVFDASDEQLVACCSCPLTPDQGATLSAKKQLIKNTLTGTLPTSITVKLVATKGGSAATDQTAEGAPGFSSGLRADRTTTHLTTDYPSVANNITEEEFKYVTISQAEYETRMIGYCVNIIGNGSGHGICVGCTKGVTGGAPKD